MFQWHLFAENHTSLIIGVINTWRSEKMADFETTCKFSIIGVSVALSLLMDRHNFLPLPFLLQICSSFVK